MNSSPLLEQLKSELVQFQKLGIELASKSLQLRTEYPQSVGDIRCEVFAQLFRSLDSYSLAFRFMLTEIFIAKRANFHFPGLMGDPELDEIVVGYERFIQNGLLYALCQVVEFALRTLFRQLNPDSHSTGYFQYEIFKPLLNTAGIPESDPCAQAIFLLFHMRNCIHNNGFFINPRQSEKTLTLTYREKSFSFQHGKQPVAAGRMTLLQITKDVNILFDRLFDLPQVSRIKHISHIPSVGMEPS